jgi:hypothetical protein
MPTQDCAAFALGYFRFSLREGRAGCFIPHGSVRPVDDNYKTVPPDAEAKIISCHTLVPQRRRSASSSILFRSTPHR